MRRVVHLRIKASAVYGCFELQYKKGLHPEHKRMSTVVTEVIESTINALRKRGELNDVSDEEADIELSRWLSQVGGASEIDVGLGVGDLLGGDRDETDLEEEPATPAEDERESSFTPAEDEDPLPGEEELTTEQKEQIAREAVGAAQRYINSEGREVFRDENDEEVEEGEPVPLASRPPWEEEGIKSLEDLGEQAGKDYLYDRVMSNPEASEADKRALQVVYSKIPRELWGTERAENLIENLKPVVERHLEARQTQGK